VLSTAHYMAEVFRRHHVVAPEVLDEALASAERAG
jgi:hypothetical protein